ncbi:hypothetical protein [Modestobacter sp. Leaf380]|uniref:hypothetical protein n=1 Tax=Modestobacter sp. Leaf380 TaxID=1736356 RepID=UPI000AC12AB8|nr:hypothetical protein [Modestobacter sp. Leaf380]
MHSEPLASDFELADVEAALMRSAAGDNAAEASVLLLLHAGHWLSELVAAGLIAVDYDDVPVTSSSDRPLRVGWAAVTWIDVDAAVLAGRIVGSGGQLRILRAAASLASGHLVDLDDLPSGLDRRHLHLLVAAIAHAGGSHQHRQEPDASLEFGGHGAPTLGAWPPRG